jgi:hypothetical protein
MEGRMDGMAVQNNASAASRHPVDQTPGVSLLLTIARKSPRYLITHSKTLADQGAKVDHLLEAGFSKQQIEHAIVGRSLPEVIRTSVGAIISSRLDELAAMPVPQQIAAGAATSKLWECENPECRTPGRGEKPADGLCPGCRAELAGAAERFTATA